jgi:hypothetical protein
MRLCFFGTARRGIYRVAIILTLTLPQAVAADPLPSTSTRITDYDIDVRLDTDAKTLSGRERLTWRNPSADFVGELWFHLYLNAFKNTNSTFFRESGGQLRGEYMPDGGWGWIEIRSIRPATGADLVQQLRFEHPDDDNADDRTVARVPLPEPVPPGGSITLDIVFEAKLPRIFARTGYEGDHFLVGQWFPKLGVYEPAGMRGRARGGWNCHQFHANSEFYADFGQYRVDITLPSRFVVGATGRRVALRDHGNGTATHTFEQADVHDFAWTADSRFVEVVRRFSAAADVTSAEYEQTAARLNRSLDDVRLSDVEIRLLLQPEHRPQMERYIRAVKLGLKHFGLWYGRYPYPTLTVVDPPSAAIGSAGMEYPTFITGGTLAISNRWPFDRLLLAEQVTIHEFGHQFWYGLVASNEFEEAWLDEGITSYAAGRLLDLAFGPDRSAASFLGLRLGNEESIQLQNTPRRTFDRIRQPSWTYSPGQYGFYSYVKPELALRTLEHLLGAEVMARVMRTYHERWRFRHPTSEDFYATASEVSGRDLRWFFDQVFEGTGVVDYEVSSLVNAPDPGVRGFVERDGRRVLLDPARGRNDDTLARSSTVVVRRLGDVVFPQTILLRYDDGGEERVHWDGRGTWTRIRRAGPRRIVAAELDPERRIRLEVSRLNGSLRADPDLRVAMRWTTRWMFWIQNLVAGAGL